MQFVAYSLDMAKASLQIVLGLADQVAVVHVSAIAMYTQDLFAVVVQPVGAGQSKDLTDLASKSKAFVAESVDQVHDQSDQARVRKVLPDDLFDQGMTDTVEELAEIESQNLAILAIFAVMIVQMFFASSDSKVIALILSAGPVIIDKSRLQNGD